nr:nectin-2-like [Aotus nancymaae]
MTTGEAARPQHSGGRSTGGNLGASSLPYRYCCGRHGHPYLPAAAERADDCTGREDEDLEGPPSYKPPTPKAKLEEQEMPSQLFTLGASEHSPLKTPYFDAGISCTDQEMPRYHELPTLEERSGPLHPGATSLGSPILVPPGPPAVEAISLDLEDEEEEEEEEDYLDKINPVYDALPSDSYQDKGFVMSRAMYV